MPRGDFACKHDGRVAFLSALGKLKQKNVDMAIVR